MRIMATGKVKLGNTMLAKVLPLVLVIPLFMRLQDFSFLPSVDFDVTQFSYLLALGVITTVSFIEFRVAQGEGKAGWAGLNIGSALGLVLTVVGLSFIVYVVALDYTYNDSAINDAIAWYMLFAIFVLSVQAIREVVGTRKVLKSQGAWGV